MLSRLIAQLKRNSSILLASSYFDKDFLAYNCRKFLAGMELAKRGLEEDSDEYLKKKFAKTECDTKINSKPTNLYHAKNRLIPQAVLDKLTEEDIDLIANVKTSCTDVDRVRAALKLRKHHRLSIRLPEDDDDTTYYIENGLRKVYPYPYLYQTYAKRRWLGKRLRNVLKDEFRDISDEELKRRFESGRILVNGDPAAYDHILKDNDFIVNRTHRHELPVLATPIKVIYEDKDTLVIDKPPSVPIHPCGRYRHNSVVGILEKEYKYRNVKVVHRLDRLVSGVLITARNVGRASQLEKMIQNRDIQKEYVCRVLGEFPLAGDADSDGYITVDQPLEHLEGKIGLTVVQATGKPSVTKFKRLNYNGKTSTVLCKPLTGRMHQIRVHLQFLGHPISNDNLYNCDTFGPAKGKGGKYGKSLHQLSKDVIAAHRSTLWMIADQNEATISETDMPAKLDSAQETTRSSCSQTDVVSRFLSDEEREETMLALGHFFTNESWLDLEQKWKFDSGRTSSFEDCHDCITNFHEPPLRMLFLYLHALRYSGTGWSYESEMPVWARDTWKY